MAKAKNSEDYYSVNNNYYFNNDQNTNNNYTSDVLYRYIDHLENEDDEIQLITIIFPDDTGFDDSTIDYRSTISGAVDYVNEVLGDDLSDYSSD